MERDQRTAGAARFLWEPQARHSEVLKQMDNREPVSTMTLNGDRKVGDSGGGAG